MTQEDNIGRQPGPAQSKPQTGSAQPGRAPAASPGESGKTPADTKTASAKAKRQARTTGGQQGGTL